MPESTTTPVPVFVIAPETTLEIVAIPDPPLVTLRVNGLRIGAETVVLPVPAVVMLMAVLPVLVPIVPGPDSTYELLEFVNVRAIGTRFVPVGIVGLKLPAVSSKATRSNRVLQALRTFR